MKFTNNPYLKTLRIYKGGFMHEQNDLSRLDIQTFCKTHGIDPLDVFDIRDKDHTIRTVFIDFELYSAAKKENEMNSMNIGSEIVYVTPAVSRLQAMRITRENIIQAAQWCGAVEIYVPSGPEHWGFNAGPRDANVGDVLVRGLNGDFEVMDQETFFKKYDRV